MKYYIYIMKGNHKFKHKFKLKFHHKFHHKFKQSLVSELTPESQNESKQQIKWTNPVPGEGPCVRSSTFLGYILNNPQTKPAIYIRLRVLNIIEQVDRHVLKYLDRKCMARH
jgi:hypothetical protein